MKMQKITPFLWFDNQAEEAANFYTSIFENSEREETTHNDTMPTADGTLISVTFEIGGQKLIAFNGGPHFSFTPAISLSVDCETQQEVDYLWEKLTEGGAESQCGWLVDKFGLSWQIVPTVLVEMLQDKDKAKAKNVMEAMMKMHKIDIAFLRQAYDKSTNV